jgi:hypothetical protein
MKETTKKIKEYFQTQRTLAVKIAEEHVALAKEASGKSEERYHNDLAWDYGVRRIKMLEDMERDIIKLV